MLSFKEDDIEFILKVYNDYKDTIPSELFPFAFDPAGNLICFDYINNARDPIVVFWEHEGAAEKSLLVEEEAEKTARENVFYVVDSFTELLNKTL